MARLTTELLPCAFYLLWHAAWYSPGPARVRAVPGHDGAGEDAGWLGRRRSAQVREENALNKALPFLRWIGQ